MEDIELVLKVKQGDMKAFELLIKKYNINLSRYVFSIVNDFENTNDIVQETFIAVYQKIDTFNKNYSFSAWLYKIAKNKSIDFIRKSSKYTLANNELSKNLDTIGTSLDDNINFHETKKLVEKFIQKQNFINKRILYLKYQNEKMTFKEISAILNLSEYAVKKRYYTMHKQFIKFAEKHIKGGVVYGL
ncbi:sigma-70 family RNA polymerase sigma factor [Clostridium sp. YIM B02505]|uniref:Sigma-70 family RNA polymerase sigma factor n=1 Tax=Clostridium yunnanense TaxID=2800325 RepID=A0ABS1EJT1_9CLOT|nr:sigma-70 family RNA polymerase sigma factor [Clostridium yunnanense]MBK1809617.1 sigma-70 family RNA polymerase sigma factor [Clostridium yunnanense]